GVGVELRSQCAAQHSHRLHHVTRAGHAACHQIGMAADVLGERVDDQVRAMLDMHNGGIQLVALSRGREGLLITDGKTCMEGLLIMENVVNVMGCGDSLLAGMASVMSRSGDLESITRKGVACGAANTQVIGAGFLDPGLVQQLEAQVDLRQIKI
ncbi:MAG TPA: PfkB family carbohydrate kinase, partial [Anaerolineales bacterium]|nr:PfkB family carbohydrate kinase [Anaerolineales bacterium]